MQSKLNLPCSAVFSCLCVVSVCYPPTWSIVKQYVLKHYGSCISEKKKKKEYMEKQTALAWASDLAKKMTAKPSEKAPEGKRVWTCQILCIHNFFLCTLFCAHQFDWMYLVIGKPKKERDHISYLHTWLTARTVSDWCSTHAAAILDMTKFHFNVFPNIFIGISYSCDCHCFFRIQFSTNKNFRENCTFSCVNANSLRFASACQILYLFIYLCRLMLMISGWICCKLPKNSGNNNDKKICPHKRESVSLSNRIPMDKEESVWGKGIKFLHQFLRVHVWKWQPQPFLPSNHSKCACETRKTLHIVVR